MFQIDAAIVCDYDMQCRQKDMLGAGCNDIATFKYLEFADFDHEQSGEVRKSVVSLGSYRGWRGKFMTAAMAPDY